MLSLRKSLQSVWMNHRKIVLCSSNQMFHSSQNIVYNRNKGIPQRQRNFSQPRNGHKSQKNQPLWLQKMHRSIIKDVRLPRPIQDGTLISDKPIRLHTTESLLSMVWNVTHINDNVKVLLIELWRRMDSMDFDQILFIADIFFINNVDLNWYHSAIADYFLEVTDFVELTPSQLTRLTFHTLNRHRTIPPSFVLALEDAITCSVDSLSLNELAVICHSFFTSQTRIRSIDLLDKISIKLIEEFDSLSNHYLPVFMKAMRYSNFIRIGFYKDLGDILVDKNYLEKFMSYAQVMHIAHAYASIRVSHPVLFSYILRSRNVKLLSRLKDFSKLIWSCGTLVTDSPEDTSAIKKILTYMEYNLPLEETRYHPDNLVDLVTGLCFLNIYPDFLLNFLFDSKSVSAIIEMSKTKESKLPQLMVIANSMDIEHSDYTGNCLSEDSKSLITSLLGDFPIETEMSIKKGMRESLEALQQLLGEDKVSCTRLLTHLPASDICLVWDTVESKFICQKEFKGRTSKQEKGHYIQLAIQILSKLQTSYDGKPLGMLHMKLRQLKTLGYHPVVIDAEESLRFMFCDTQTTQVYLLKAMSPVIGTDLTDDVHHNETTS